MDHPSGADHHTHQNRIIDFSGFQWLMALMVRYSATHTW